MGKLAKKLLNLENSAMFQPTKTQLKGLKKNRVIVVHIYSFFSKYKR